MNAMILRRSSGRFEYTRCHTFTKAAGAGAFARCSLSLRTSLPAADLLQGTRGKGTILIALLDAQPSFNLVNDQNEGVGFDPAIDDEIG